MTTLNDTVILYRLKTKLLANQPLTVYESTWLYERALELQHAVALAPPHLNAGNPNSALNHPLVRKMAQEAKDQALSNCMVTRFEDTRRGNQEWAQLALNGTPDTTLYTPLQAVLDHEEENSL